MRDPLVPIPSPAAPTKRAEGFWTPVCLPPPLPAADAPPHDPLAGLRGRGDLLGIDRRHAQRDGDEQKGSSRTAALHEPISGRILGLRSRHGWTLCRGLALHPAGLLVLGVDPLDPHLAPHLAEEARAVLPALAPVLGASRRAGARGCHSLLGLVGGCLLAPRLLEDLAHWGSGVRPIPVTLCVPGSRTRRRGGDPPALCVDGMLAPMTDPGPDVLAIALTAEAHARLRPHIVRSPRADLTT
jgi:hypothetical protein